MASSTSVVIVAGVAGAGKTTVGRALAARLAWPFLDADTFHAPASIAKMRRGEALTDADREPWLATLAGTIDAHAEEGRRLVLAASGLRRAHREQLRHGRSEVVIVALEASRATLERRLAGRHDHFAGVALLDSQLATWEAPGPDEAPFVHVVPAEARADEVVDAILEALRVR